MVADSPEQLAAPVGAHRLGEVRLKRETVSRARVALEAAGLLVVGEAYGVRETPNVLYALAPALGTRAVAFERSHEELDAFVQTFARNGSLPMPPAPITIRVPAGTSAVVPGRARG